MFTVLIGRSIDRERDRRVQREKAANQAGLSGLEYRLSLWHCSQPLITRYSCFLEFLPRNSSHLVSCRIPGYLFCIGWRPHLVTHKAGNKPVTHRVPLTLCEACGRFRAKELWLEVGRPRPPSLTTLNP